MQGTKLEAQSLLTESGSVLLSDLKEPLAITMWDFSWLERRWPGAGYENIGKALDELVDRGYNAIRIDAYPHLIAQGRDKKWTLRPPWNQHDWGAPSKCTLQVQPHLNDFLRHCADRGIKAGLSSWYQKTEEFDLQQISTPIDHAEIWRQTIDSIADANLLDSVLYVDFCNEWPFTVWAPFFRPGDEEDRRWAEGRSISWMKESVAELRASYPDIPYTYSYVGKLNFDEAQIDDIRSANDFLEPHVWMCHANSDEFYNKIGGYHYHQFEPTSYEQVAEHAQSTYEENTTYWKGLLEQHIDKVVEESLALDLPLITTECWGIVEYKDWPRLEWEWIKELCAHGVQYASSQGRWIANATSNFCGPQFVGMWRDIDWHRELTDCIKSAPLPTNSKQALNRPS